MFIKSVPFHNYLINSFRPECRWIPQFAEEVVRRRNVLLVFFYLLRRFVLSLLNEQEEERVFRTTASLILLQNSQKKDKNKEPWNCCEINGVALVRLPSNHRSSQELVRLVNHRSCSFHDILSDRIKELAMKE